MVTTEAAFAIARRTGRARNAMCRWASARCPAALDMDAASRANAIANGAGRDCFASCVSLKTINAI